jgi:carbon-monoxide dehydrogenase large subunit
MIIDGQTHGGIVQGIGQALLERCIYGDDGQLLSGSMMDYALPRASDAPLFETEILELPSATNELGVRAGGEGGVVPAPAAIMNALLDALRPLGVSDLPLPATPQAIWRAIKSGRGDLVEN